MTDDLADAAKDWDWATQKADTEAVWADLSQYPELAEGAPIHLDLHFVAAGEAGDKAGLVGALRQAGYSLEIFKNNEDVETVQASVETVFDPVAIWAAEEAGTRLALAHGYRPDGWGFWEPDA